MVFPFFLQCSLQYLPYSLSLDTVQLQAGWAHLVVSAIADLLPIPYASLSITAHIFRALLPL